MYIFNPDSCEQNIHYECIRVLKQYDWYACDLNFDSDSRIWKWVSEEAVVSKSCINSTITMFL